MSEATNIQATNPQASASQSSKKEKKKGGSKPRDPSGEVRSEKVNLYLTPSLMGEVRLLKKALVDDEGLKDITDVIIRLVREGIEEYRPVMELCVEQEKERLSRMPARSHSEQ